MTHEKNITQYLVIADDFTGATDTGVQLKKRGLTCDVVLTASHQSTTDAIVLDTESRSLTGERAFQKVSESISFLKLSDYRLVYKKVDSTLRGNIAEEVKAIADAYQPDRIVFAPAYPKIKRKTVDGVHYVGDQRLLATDMVQGPSKKIKTDRLSDILAATFHEPVTNHHLSTPITADLLEFGLLHTFDIIFDADLTALAEYCLAQNQKILYVGSAGLAEALFRTIQQAPPVLAIVGSVSEKSLAQIQYAEQAGVTIFQVAPVDIFEPQFQRQYCQQIQAVLAAGEDVILTACKEKADYQRVLTIGAEKGFTKSQCSQQVQTCLASIATQVLKGQPVAGIFLTGGATAISVIEYLKGHGSRIHEEILTGMVISQLISTEFPDLNMITKAGAFGDQSDLLYCIEKLKERYYETIGHYNGGSGRRGTGDCHQSAEQPYRIAK